MIRRSKYLALGVVVTLLGAFSFQFVSAGNEEVNEQMLMQEENEALRAENEQIDKVAREQEDDIRMLEEQNKDLYGQLIIYRDQVNQIEANNDREFYMEDE